MRNLWKVGLVVGLSFVLTGSVSAQGQGRGGRGGFGFGGPRLINNKSVQQELKLTEEQVKKADEAVKQADAKHKDEMDALRDIEDMQERGQKRGEIQKAVSAEINKALDEVLKPEQTKRFKQIVLQVQGTQAFGDEEVQKTLKFTDDQKDKLKTIQADAMAAFREAFQANQDDPEARNKKMAELRKETTDKVMAVLTDDQKKSWKEMTGEPFTIKMEGRGGRGKKKDQE